MMKIIAATAAALMAVQVSAGTNVVGLGTIIVPPTQTSSIGTTFTDTGDNTGLYEFTIGQPNTVGVSSFTNSAVGGTGVFDFTWIRLYSGSGTTGTLLQTGTIVPRAGGTTQAFLGDYAFTAGDSYTIAYNGTVSGSPSSVGSSITFAPAAAVPEPASWALMVAGFGLSAFRSAVAARSSLPDYS